MRAEIAERHTRVIEYDAMRRRLWILGQRCHHGAAGGLCAALAALGLISDTTHHETPASTLLALAAAGSALMVHDWHDRAIWFQPGYQDQP